MKTRIENVTLFDGISEKVESTSILFDKNILAIGKDALNSPVDKIIDGSGLTCLPGLFDIHIHVTIDPDSCIKDKSEKTPGISMINALKNAYRHIMAGVVTVRSLGSENNIDIDLKKAIEEGLVKGPRVFASGYALCITGGHGHASISLEVDGVDEVRKAARMQIKKGANVIKVMATGGGMTKGNKPGASQLSEEELRAACIEASNVGITTASHAQGCEGIKNAIRAGITTIDHGVELDDEAISLMKEKGTYLVPTLAAPYHTVKNGVEAGIPEWAVKKNRQAMIPHRESFRKAYKAGVKIATGTDAGTPFNRHGDFATELELMIQEGMTVQDVVKSATYLSAEALGIEKFTGSIENGKWADLILVEGDPEEDLAAFRRVLKVFKEGECLFDKNKIFGIKDILNI